MFNKLNSNVVVEMGEPTPPGYRGECDESGEKFKEHDLVYYCPKSKKWICPECFYDNYEGHEKCLEYEIIDGNPQEPVEPAAIREFEKII